MWRVELACFLHIQRRKSPYISTRCDYILKNVFTNLPTWLWKLMYHRMEAEFSEEQKIDI